VGDDVLWGYYWFIYWFCAFCTKMALVWIGRLLALFSFICLTVALYLQYKGDGSP